MLYVRMTEKSHVSPLLLSLKIIFSFFSLFEQFFTSALADNADNLKSAKIVDIYGF